MDVTWSFEQLSLPTIGDQSVAWRATARHVAQGGLTQDLPATGDVRLTFIAFRRKDLVALGILTSGHEPGDPAGVFLGKSEFDELQSFANATDAKLQMVVDRVHAD